MSQEIMEDPRLSRDYDLDENVNLFEFVNDLYPEQKVKREEA